jgi:hypothetical protein
MTSATSSDGRAVLAGLGAAWLLLLALLVVSVSGCGQEQEPQPAPASAPAEAGGIPPLVCGTALPPTPPATVQDGPPVEITDRQGHVWDISTAVYKYGFEPDEFDYGLGVNVIRPISGPDFYAPGDPDYPLDGDDFSLVGLTRDDEARAYPLEILSRHEIVNDFVGDAHLAVSY